MLRGALPMTTQRCVLREARMGDVEAVHAYRGLPEVTRFLGLYQVADAARLRLDTATVSVLGWEHATAAIVRWNA